MVGLISPAGRVLDTAIDSCIFILSVCHKAGGMIEIEIVVYPVSHRILTEVARLYIQRSDDGLQIFYASN